MPGCRQVLETLVAFTVKDLCGSLEFPDDCDRYPSLCGTMTSDDEQHSDAR